MMADFGQQDMMVMKIMLGIITGGAIKLTATMQEREHTLQELQ